ncbi:hypothetical protein G6F50_018262 [Rhizopus delemar]|uniref:Uncharacterized protein n=1 Tax=Rhizopus delemar TaxID=936053 RepID=A0A9P6XMZ9_9FUNG|nr:hypothetical protein G6F50_018262 [Rhizopus delemar]
MQLRAAHRHRVIDGPHSAIKGPNLAQFRPHIGVQDALHAKSAAAAGLRRCGSSSSISAAPGVASTAAILLRCPGTRRAATVRAGMRALGWRSAVTGVAWREMG